MSKTQRAIWLAIALVFVATSIGFSALTIWQASKDRENQKVQEGLEEALNQQSQEDTLGTLAGFTPTDQRAAELQKIDTQTGTGQEVPTDPSVKVTVHYTGALVKDGKVFDSSVSRGTPATFALNQVIPGWTQGIPGMKEGGKRRLIIPASLAYGSQGNSSIPPDSDLVFDVELIKIGE